MSLLEGDLIIIRMIGATLSSKQDAYCLIDTNLDSVSPPSSKRKTFVIQKSSNPEWNNEFVISVNGLKSIPHQLVSLTFTVMDENKLTKDELVGVANLQIDTSEFHVNEQVKKTLLLNTQKKNEIEIAVRVVRINAESSNSVHKCSIHNITMNAICKSCNKLMCSACAVSNLHNTHDIHLIEDVESKERDEVLQFKNQVEKWQNEESISIIQLESELGNTEISTTETKQVISNQFLQLRELISKKESEVMSKIDKKGQFRNNYLQELLNWKLSCDEMFNNFEKLKPYDFLESKLTKFENLQKSFNNTKTNYQTKNLFTKDLEKIVQENQNSLDNITNNQYFK